MLHAIAPAAAASSAAAASRMNMNMNMVLFLSYSSSSCPSPLFLRPYLCHFHHKLKLRSSLRDSDKATLRKAKASPNLPNNLKFDRQSTPDKDNDQDQDQDQDQTQDSPVLDDGVAVKGTVLAGLLLVGVIGGFGGVGYVYRAQINSFLTQFSEYIDGYGPAGYALFVLVYAGLEVYIYICHTKSYQSNPLCFLSLLL
jgi:hypothetical protein